MRDGTDLAFLEGGRHHEVSLRELPGTTETQWILHLIQMIRREEIIP